MNAVESFPKWFTVILAIWSAVGPLVGVICGGWLARDSERAKWINENKKQEFRKLLDAFARATEVTYGDGMGGSIQYTVRELRNNAVEIAGNVLKDRIFIAPALEKHRVSEQFAQAIETVEENSQQAEFVELMMELHQKILSIARSELGIGS